MRYAYLLALLFIPAPLLSADTPVTVPFEFHHNMIFVEASIGDSVPLQMALDSGTVRTTVDEAVARRLGLDLSMKAQSSGANGVQEISVMKNQTLRFHGLEVAEPMMVAYPLGFLADRVGHRVDGIIGIELFRKFVVEIDYAAQQVRLWQPDSFVYSGTGEVLPVTYYKRLPVVAGSVTPFEREAIPTAFQLDTGGAGLNVVFWKGFHQKHDLLAGTRNVSEYQERASAERKRPRKDT